MSLNCSVYCHKAYRKGFSQLHLACSVFVITGQVKAHLVELLLDLFQASLVDDPNLDDFIRSLTYQISNSIDVGVFQAMIASHGEIQFFDVNGQ